MRMARLLFLLFLFGEDCLHHIAGLGDVGQVNLRSDRLLAACVGRTG
jgi:hypothetical protein